MRKRNNDNYFDLVNHWYIIYANNTIIEECDESEYEVFKHDRDLAISVVCYTPGMYCLIHKRLLGNETEFVSSPSKLPRELTDFIYPHYEDMTEERELLHSKNPSDWFFAVEYYKWRSS